jgi:calcium-activated chloride channel regulator 3/4
MIQITKKTKLFVFALSLFIFFATFQLQSTIPFKNGSFDILVVISEKEKEDLDLVNRIAAEMKAASEYLWNATGKQHKFGKVTILIPKNWSDQNDYQPLTNENPNSANIEIGSGITGAFASAQKISISTDPGYLNGPTIVHEFGHAIYGLGDEYCDYDYRAKVQKTFQVFKKGGKWLKCTANVSYEVDVDEVEQGQSYSITKRTANNETSCIMWIQFVNGIVNFCGHENHNKVGTHQQNTNAKSCKETMEGQYGYKQVDGVQIAYTDPTVIKVKNSNLSDTSLVIDRSGSMDGNPLRVAKNAAKKFVQITADDNYLGVVSFSSGATVTRNLTRITGPAKPGIQNAINAVFASGRTSIGAGLLKGMDMVCSHQDPKYRKVVIVFTDGEENTAPYIKDVENRLVAKKIMVHAIGIGNIGASNAALRSLCKQVGGVYQTVNDYSGLPGIFNDIYGRINPGQTVLSNVQETIAASETRSYQIEVDSSISDMLKFSVDSQYADSLEVTLTSPNGITFNSSYQGYRSSDGYKLFEVANIDISTGAWVMTVSSNHLGQSVATISAVGKSSIRTLAYVKQEEVTYPAPIHIMAAATQNGEVIRGLNASAQIVSPTGIVYTLPLSDNGVNGDSTPVDGSYEGDFYQFDGNGNYSITILFNNNNATATLGVGFPELFGNRNPEIEKVALERTRNKSLQENFNRQINAPSVTVTNYSYLEPIRPGNIGSLKVDSINGEDVTLRWIAPGEKGYIGTANAYEMRYSTSELTDENFESGTEIKGLVVPQAAGSYEEMTITAPGNAIYYFAIRALNSETAAKISNNLIVSTLVNLKSSRRDVRTWLTDRTIANLTVKIGNIQEQNIARLVLCRKEADAAFSAYGEIKEIDATDFENNVFQYIDKKIEKGKSYSYIVKALGPDGAEVMTSNQSSL